MQQDNGVAYYGMDKDREGDMAGSVKDVKRREMRSVENNGRIGPMSSRLHDV